MYTKKVLLPLDGSPFSRHILPSIYQLIKPEEAELIVLRVAPWPKSVIERPVRVSPLHWLVPLDPGMFDTLPNAAITTNPFGASHETERAHARILDELHEETQELRLAGYRITLAVEFGDPVEAIITLVEHRAVDLVAMATHGRSGLSHFVLGSVAEQVLHRVPVPVLLVRPDSHATQVEDHTHNQQAAFRSS